MDASAQGLTWECYRIPGVSARGAWRQLIVAHLERQQTPYSFDVQGQTLRVWDSRARAQTIRRSTLTYRDGYQIRPVAFGGSRSDTLIGISMARVYFEHGDETPSHLSANELLQKGQYPPPLRHLPMLAGISDLIACLKRAPELESLVQHREYTAVALHNQITYRTSTGRESLHSMSVGDGLYKSLLNLVRNHTALQPAPVRLGVLTNLSKDPERVYTIANYVVGVLRDWGCDAEWFAIENSEGGKQFVSEGRTENVILLPLDGERGDRPTANAKKWLEYLDSERMGFHLCSTASNPVYSQHGIATAVLQKAGGVLFTTQPIRNESFQTSWFIGLDLGYGGQRECRLAAITLTDSNGCLQAYWRTLKDKKESLSLDLLTHGLGWIVGEAMNQDPNRNLVLIRDGTCPRDENIDHYKMAMGQHPFTLIEYAKTGSPLIHVDKTEPNPGTLLIPESSQFATMYACISPQSSVLTYPVKFRMRRNPTQLSHEEVGEMLLALCHSATLSFQPSRVPAPLRYANGLAKLSWTDLQYAGWSYLPNHTVDLRE